jgi:uncharacterized protein YciI
MHFLLFYETTSDYLERRAEFRADHLKLAWQSHDRGELILGGALSDPADKAILFFQGDSPDFAENFAKNDPYVCNGLVRRWYVRQWITVVGDTADTPIRYDI